MEDEEELYSNPECPEEKVSLSTLWKSWNIFKDRKKKQSEYNCKYAKTSYGKEQYKKNYQRRKERKLASINQFSNSIDIKNIDTIENINTDTTFNEKITSKELKDEKKRLKKKKNK